MRKLAIISTHPIQYNAPLFRLLAADEGLALKVFYTKESDTVRYDADFKREITWDIDLYMGYDKAFHNAATRQGLKNLIGELTKFNPYALLVFGWNPPGHFAIMRHFKGKCAVWFRGDSTLLDPMPIWKSLIRRTWLRHVYRHIDKAFYVGTANRDYFLSCGLEEHQLIHTPHAVDNEFFASMDANRQREIGEKKREFGLSSESVVFLFAGKFEEKKQPVALRDAFNLFQNQNPKLDAHLIFVGSGHLQDNLKATLSKSVHVVGFQNQSQMPLWYGVADVLCLPSKGPGETWGLAVNEAMNAGCMALVTERVGCHLDLVKHESLGMVIDSEKPETWPNAFQTMHKRVAGQRAEIASRCRNFIKQFNLGLFADALSIELNDPRHVE